MQLRDARPPPCLPGSHVFKDASHRAKFICMQGQIYLHGRNNPLSAEVVLQQSVEERKERKKKKKKRGNAEERFFVGCETVRKVD